MFISYARSDSNLSERLADELDAKGFRCWLDKKEITAGKNWEDELRNALERVKTCLVVLSDDADSSRPKLSKEWAAMLESSWRRKDLALCSLNIDKGETPPFLRKWQSVRIDKTSTEWEQLVAETVRLIENSQTHSRDVANEEEHANVSRRFAELRSAIEVPKPDEADRGDK